MISTARDFDGVDDYVSATITAVDSGDWTIGAWIYPDNAGEANVGTLLAVFSGTAARQIVRMNSSGRTWIARQVHATTNADAITSTTLAAGAWSCIFSTYRSSDSKCRVYIGDLDSAVAEAAYSSQPAGSGARSTGGTTLMLGNNTTGFLTQTWDGRIALVFFDVREWSLDEMEVYRIGMRPVQTGGLRIFWPLDSPTAAQAEDLSGNGTNGTVSGATAIEGPPIASDWGEGAWPVVSEPVAGGTTYEKTGIAITALTASGADVVESADAGTGSSPRSGSGDQEVAVSETGSGQLPHSGSGADATTFTETGTGVIGSGWGGEWGGPWGGSGMSGSGADAVTYVEAGAGVSDRSGSGVDAVTYSETGTGISARGGSGAKEYIPATVTYEKTGTGVSARSGSGADAVIYGKAGTGASDRVGSGARAIVYTKSGVATIVFGGSGSRVRIIEKTGAGISVFSASGARAAQFARGGTGVLAMSGSGAIETKIVIGDFDPPGADGSYFDAPTPAGGGFDAPSPRQVVLA